MLKVKDEMVNEYKTTAPWNMFGRIIGFNEERAVVGFANGVWRKTNNV